jgi:hypothetical protein
MHFSCSLLFFEIQSNLSLTAKIGKIRKKFHRTFHRFGQAKFADGGLILGWSQFTLLAQLPSK